MTKPALEFTDSHLLGQVAGVDTHRVVISIHNSTLVTRIGVGNLVAICGSTEQDFLIAIVERVVRSISPSLPEIAENEEDDDISLAPVDTVRATLIGTYRVVDGAKSNTFKRGADTFPQIDRNVYVVEAGNLQSFMGLLGAGFDEEERLKLGRFVADANAEAIASGDRLFQRHAAILGSTGSGKSYAVALLLEYPLFVKHQKQSFSAKAAVRAWRSE